MRHIHNSRIQNWRVDSDGMLRVTARVLKEGVFDYAPDESPESSTLNDEGNVSQYIPLAEFTPEALHSLEGKPVIIDDHVWRDADNTMHDGLTVGAVAGTPKVEDGYIVADFIISDADTVEAIKSGKLVEVSSAYDGDCTADAGVFDGQDYGAVQHNLRFNHVLLLPEGAGRCGPSVGIVNKKSVPCEVEKMGKIIQRQFGNRRMDFKFQNEDDAATANEMAEEERKFNAEALNNAMCEAEQLKNEIDEKQKALDEALAVVKEQREKIDELMSAETQEALAQEAAAQTEAEEAILDDAIENEVIEEEVKEEVKNSFKNCKTFAERRCVVVNAAMAAGRDELKGWTQEAFDGAFEMLHKRAIMNAKRNRSPKSIMGGAKSRTGNSGFKAPLQRIYERIQNSKSGGDR